ncbi:hypothetical protein N825_00625 [Skermanella stibiiresistens SB22]|uniref:Uncharacterized protein n=1 Tax=Skermanella stibiiresistens SB22 TaxID=1385369 RepID=W9HFW8_9PROT|nr:hypothetical protein N825_00625 [Skermanella stibiiresistens SB22]
MSVDRKLQAVGDQRRRVVLEQLEPGIDQGALGICGGTDDGAGQSQPLVLRRHRRAPHRKDLTCQLGGGYDGAMGIQQGADVFTQCRQKRLLVPAFTPLG